MRESVILHDRGAVPFALLVTLPIQAFAREVVYGIEVFERGTGTPTTIEQSFTVDERQVALLRVYNGWVAQEPDEGTHVTAGEIRSSDMITAPAPTPA